MGPLIVAVRRYTVTAQVYSWLPWRSVMIRGSAVPSTAAENPTVTDRKPITGGYRNEPRTAAPVSRPPSAADRAGKSSPAIARMTGKIGPKAKPTTAKSAIDRGRDGTNTAATRAHDATLMHAVANARWSKRSAIRADTRRPSANPPQKSERLVVASVSGAAS